MANHLDREVSGEEESITSIANDTSDGAALKGQVWRGAVAAKPGGEIQRFLWE